VGAGKVNALDAICDALDFIQTHLQSPIAVADVAAAVGYSIYHFCRTFNQVTHHTPYDYLIRRRLAEATEELVHGSRRAIDVALDYGFNSPETFSRAFRRVYGLSPRQARKAGRVDPWRVMPRLTRAHLEHLHKGAYLKPARVEREKLYLVGAMILLHPARSADCKSTDLAPVEALWAWLERELALLDKPLAPSPRYGVTYYTKEWETRGCSYMAAVPAQDTGPPLPGLATQLLPAGPWARFVHKGTTRELGLTLDYVFHTWLGQSEFTLAQPLVVEEFYKSVRQAEQPDGERAILVPLAHT